ncbi:prepilin-type N-terminal cleavage/methylation domain-containing protein [Thiomicrospira sp.]|uniref:prepilin-type N-terminal cleavage/methylation domain-containing protein n=1 Tax=Thiomicrospira sp. TaxID=935 RepID=UPI002F924B98
MQTQNKQKGFTLIEIAIVLVIIGLLLGGVLKGQELIKSAKVKAAAGDVNAYSVALIGYQDRYGDLFTNGTKTDAYIAGGTPVTTATDTEGKSTAMLNELSARGFISAKTQHALGGEIVLIKNGVFTDGTLGSTDLARNDSTEPKTFNWAVCYTGINTEEDLQGLIRAIDGSSVDFTTTFAVTTSPYVTGRARVVDATDYDTPTSAPEDETVVCFEI